MERGWKCVVELVALGAILKLGAVVDFKEHGLPGQEFCTILMAMLCNV